jgi:hypothetical protein
MTLIRQAITDLNDLTRQTDVRIVDDMVKYYNRQTDKTILKNAINTRYGYGIKLVSDGTESGTIETYANDGFQTQLNAGMIPAISSGFGQKVVNALATLFTERSQKYTLTHPTVEDTKPAETFLNMHRAFGGYTATMTGADKLSVQAGSSAVLVSWARNHLAYQKYSPGDITVYFGEYIEDDGKLRLVDNTDLNDATAIRIRLSQHDSTIWNYLLIMGRSDVWEQGRYVTYQADETGGEMPQEGDKGVFDWYPEGSDKPANPLSYYADENPEESDIPEYPLAILYGGTTDSGDVMPVSTSLYEDSVEIDMGSSHLQSTSQSAAVGITEFSRNSQGRNHPLPTKSTGTIATDDGTETKFHAKDSQASVDGISVQKDLQVQVASGYGVPDYMAVSEDHMLEAASGISLQVKTKPLKQARKDRVELNQPFVRDIFAIEKILLELFSEDNASSEFTMLKECEQSWDAGELEVPENKKEKTERIVAAKAAGLIDEIEAIRQAMNFVTDEEATEFYKTMAERKDKYPPLNPEPEKKKPLGLPGRTNTTQL